MQAKQRDRKPCVYSNVNNHKNSECEKVKGIQDCKKTLSGKKLCFNCTEKENRASLFKSKRSCQIYQRKHRTSIRHKNSEMMMAAEMFIYLVVVVKANNKMCQAFLDTGVGSSCASAALLDQLKLKPIKKETKNIDKMMSSTIRKLEIFDVKMSELSEKFKIDSTVYKVETDALLSLPNPKHKAIIDQYKHLAGINMNDNDTKTELFIHMILGASDYARIKAREMPTVGSPGEPVAE